MSPRLLERRWSIGVLEADGSVVNPLFAFSFLESFLETLQDYLGDVTETALKDNFDIVYMAGSPSYSPLQVVSI